jgi:glycerophosphoryl diester phosphodiesterase
MDVHMTADGEVVVIHDPLVDRTTDGAGAITSMTLSELKELDAGYRFTPDGGKTFPFRGKGITIPTFREVLEAFPSTPMNIEIKVDDPVLTAKFLALLEHFSRFTDVTVLVLIAAEKDRLANRVRASEPRAVTGHSYWEVARFLLLSRLRLARFFTPRGPALQVPDRNKWFRVTTPTFIRAAHALGLEVHVWTINEESEMRRLLTMGADALFTDFPGRMRKLVDSGNWSYKPNG